MNYPAIWLCVDAAERDDFRGVYSLPDRGGEERPFSSLMEMVGAMDCMMDAEEADGAAARPSAAPEPVRTGAAATFLIRPLYRRNASWQGTLRWLEGEREASFRSVLEMYSLLHGVLSAEGKPAPAHLRRMEAAGERPARTHRLPREDRS